MGAISKILEQIQSLTISERLLLMERLLRSIREETDILSKDARMELAAKSLLKDYQTDDELTAFTSLDSEDFYE